MNYLFNFNISSKTESVKFDVEPLVSSFDFTDFPSKMIEDNNYINIIDIMISYFDGMNKEYKQESIDSLKSLPLNNDEDYETLNDTFKNIIMNAKWLKSYKVPTTDEIEGNQSVNVGKKQIDKILFLFINLFSEAVNDPNVEDYSTGLMSKAIVKFTDFHESMGDGSRIKNILELIFSGISPICKSSTKQASIDLEMYIKELFPIDIKHVKFSKSNIREEIRNKVMSGSMVKDKINILSKVDTKDPTMIKYINSSSKQISKLNINNFNEPSSYGARMSKRITDKIGYFVKTSGLRDTIVNGTVSLITATMPDKNKKTNTNNTMSNLNVYTELSKNNIIVSFKGNLDNESINGSYTISTNLLRHISENVMFNSLDLNIMQRKRITSSIGDESGSLQGIWNSFIVYLFSYLSIIVYCLLNEDNILSLDVVDLDENLMIFLGRDYINNINDKIKNNIDGIDMPGSKYILSFIVSRGWPTLMYT